ncbi:metallophosphoesterase family protein [Pacificoceanicola onchidii]|uniref:metallophosphoesterase family protein n=1 Tax=Pacificoceanicola onchidii TaxID=2562685 RepID=UPI0010A6AE2A|nr:metallophosphoesterase family protein [Pacificoceanicola onchidii]
MLTERIFRGDLPAGGPLLIFGGPYSNLHATRAMRAEADRRGIPADRTICTGDVVAYCAHPEETVAEVRDWGCHVIAGNVERQLGEGALDCGCGFEEGTACDLLSAGWYAHANAQVSAETRSWMAGLPDVLILGSQWGRLGFVHGGTRAVNRFLWPDTPDAVLRAEIAHLDAQPAYVFAGHSGIPFQRRVADTFWVNAGVIGMPPHDGRTETRYAVLHEDGQVEICTLTYDAEGAAAAMETAHLRQGYHTALRSGFWPSEDILPAAFRR